MIRKLLAVVMALGLAVAVSADWEPGDGHKMHFPQLPDEAGWNVKSSFEVVLADDWQCSESGPVTDIHFWGSWKEGNTGDLRGFAIAIYSDIPDPDPSDPATYSQPGQLLWNRYFSMAEIQTQHITPSPQIWEGWFDPVAQQWVYPDHDNYYQYNIIEIEDPFVQEEGTIYWLQVTADVVGQVDPQPEWGWKSSTEHFNDKAVYMGPGTCVAPDNGSGTIDYPPDCPFEPVPGTLLEITDGLPPGSSIEIDFEISSFDCTQLTECSGSLPPGICEAPGGGLGGTFACFNGMMNMQMTGTGDLSGFTRAIALPVAMEVHLSPRNPGDPIQIMTAGVFHLHGELFGDPDFCTLRILAGSDNGLPGPGEVTLTDLGDGNFNVDSFFDITYQIEFEGCPGSILEGMGGTTVQTTPTIMGSGLSWSPLDEPQALNPIDNFFTVTVDPGGTVIDGFGQDAYGNGWYFYPEFGWWNIWFYDHPFSYDRYKIVHIEMDAFPLDAGPAFIELAVNWSTDLWSLEGNPPGERRPPLPEDGAEEMWIGRHTVFAAEQFGGHYSFDFVLDNYNPEWVSIDVRGFNFIIPEGIITHECVAQQQEQLDLAFVITGTGASCCIIRGDVNHNGTGPDIADLVYLANFMFQGGPPPPCEEPPGSGYYSECDVNGDGAGPNVTDLVYLVTYMFQGGPAPVPCP